MQHREQNNTQFQVIFIIILSFFSIFLSLAKGSTSISLDQLLFTDNRDFQAILFKLRLPRTVSSFVCGGLLALAGSLMQLLLQNPLADPYALGISGGAALVILLMMLFGVTSYGLIPGACLGSLLTMVLIFMLARKHRWQTHALLLSGIALACGYSAGISFILLVSPATNLHSMLFWLTGDLSNAQPPWVGMGILATGMIICQLLAPGFNILSRGEREASALGLLSYRYQIALYLLSSIFTATAVALAGCIGFIGLIVPHLTRFLIGYDHRRLLPLTVLLGGSLLTIADTLARSLFAPEQLPVGILMAMIGIPIFLWLLQK